MNDAGFDARFDMTRDRFRAGRIALACAWALLVAVLAVGHVTALRNSLTVLVSLVTLAICAREWRTIPCKSVTIALLAWAAVSILWSPATEVSWGKWRTDLLLPLLAGAAVFCFVRRARGFRVIVLGLVLGLAALSALSIFAYVPVEWVPKSWALEQSAGIVRPLPHWYPGPGDASMFAIFCIAPLYVAWRTTTVAIAPVRVIRRERVLLLVAWLLLALVSITTNNRNAVLVAPAVLILAIFLDRRARRGSTTAIVAGDVSIARHVRMTERRSARVAIVVFVALLSFAAIAAVLELGARERLRYLHKPLAGESAAIELLSNDTRPAIWRYYIVRGLEHPWIGMGFGRTVPGIGWRTESDRELAAVEPNAYIHAHNVVLNWWLQLGVVGLALLGTAMVVIVRTAASFVQAADASRRPAARLVYQAVIVTLVATLARNLTDDFLVYAMATTFCVVIGALLGEASRLAAGSGNVSSRHRDFKPVEQGEARSRSLRAEARQHRPDGSNADDEIERE